MIDALHATHSLLLRWLFSYVIILCSYYVLINLWMKCMLLYNSFNTSQITVNKILSGYVVHSFNKL